MSDNEQMKDLYYTFGKNFLGASILYIPKSVLELSRELNFNTKSWTKFTNKILVFEENGNNYFIEDDVVSITIFQKKNLLESNMLYLLKLKEEFLPITFAYILKKYKEQLIAYRGISQWLTDNVSIHIPNLTIDQKSAFKIQNDAFLAHQMEFMEIFGELMNAMPQKVLSEKSDTIKETLHVVLESQQEAQFTSIGNKEAMPSTNRKIKMMNLKKLTKSYADELILKQIFNLDIRAI